ncbi:MAG TPA: tetratricopeptide repeat protein [Gemmatimonadales bacterium]|jgi:tetratricopeptide (TPR) repeat protein
MTIRLHRFGGAVTFLLIAAVPVVAAAQVQTNSTATPLGRGLMAERNGTYGDAAKIYQAILQTEPANVGALIGMEHVLPQLGRGPEMLTLSKAALAIDSTSIGVLQVAVRAFAHADRGDSARKYVERWAALAPHDEDPYREWSNAALEARDIGEAQRALDLGRQRLGPEALGVERAELFRRSGNLGGAAREWVAVIRATPAFGTAAVTVLSQVAQSQRTQVRDALMQDGSIEAKQLLGFLLAGWGESTQALSLVRGALPADSVTAIVALRRLYGLLHAHDDNPSKLAAAATLEAIAARESGRAAVETLMDAARAYADAGNEKQARRLLDVVGSRPDAPAGMANTASTTLLGVLIAEGKAADAEKVLAQLGPTITPDEHDRLARRIAMVWLRAGNFARATQLVASDSSTSGFDLRGRIALYRGDLAGANDLLKAAGPYDEEREQALQRITVLTLIQAIGADSLPALGEALLTLERGDTSKAVTDLTVLAATVRPAGAAETRLFAGQIALAARDTVRATELLRGADVKNAPAASAAARLALARIAVASGHVDDARHALEQLIIDYPESAVVPEARRLHDSLGTTTPGSAP